MTPFRLALASLVLFAALLPASRPAHAAESYDNCAGYIDTVPATISTQGVWCLRDNISTNIVSGNAITIATNNVTIDCNDFKIGGLAAGEGSQAIGILADNRQNVTIRNCGIRGFVYGIQLNSGAGHLIEDNRLDNNLYVGIMVSGDNSTIRRNRIYDTGGATGGTDAAGIAGMGDFVDNVVSGVFADKAGGTLYGIKADQVGADIRGNKVSGFVKTAADSGPIAAGYGIYLGSKFQRASDNQIVGNSPTVNGYGIDSPIFANNCLNNSIGGFTVSIDHNCHDNSNQTL
jgi:parallel beta-helix repeat protein